VRLSAVDLATAEAAGRPIGTAANKDIPKMPRENVADNDEIPVSAGQPLRRICALHFCRCNCLVAGYYLYKDAGKISYEEL
jgi:hypothetical protein